MSLPSFSPGDVLSAADCNDYFLPIAAYKTNSTGRSSTTISADPDLAVTVAANAVYYVAMNINYQAASSSVGLKTAFSTPASATGEMSIAGPNATGGLGVGVWGFSWTDTPIWTNSTTDARGLQILGTLITSSTSGTFSFNWASNTSTTMNINAGSVMILHRIS